MKAINFLEWCKKIKAWHSDNDNQKKIINDALFKVYETERFYSQPFKPEMITELFENEKLRQDKTVDLNVSYFRGDIVLMEHLTTKLKIKYTLGRNKVPILTLNDFISDCNRAGIELNWKPEIITKYFS